jgi:hypothetical protein
MKWNKPKGPFQEPWMLSSKEKSKNKNEIKLFCLDIYLHG